VRIEIVSHVIAKLQILDLSHRALLRLKYILIEDT